MSYDIRYSGHLVIQSTLWVIDDVQKDFAHLGNIYVRSGQGSASINFGNVYIIQAATLPEEISNICAAIYKKDPHATVTGTIYWAGDDAEDAGYVAVANNIVSTYLKLSMFVPESEYNVVTQLVHKYLESELKEFISEGITNDTV